VSTASGVQRKNIHDTSPTRSSASAKPRDGERTIAAAVLRKPDQTTAWNPACATPAPTNPPISACELLEGIPNSQVKTSQTIAPHSAEKMTPTVTAPGSMMPLPTVVATLSPNTRKAMKLKNDAQNTAKDGRSTRVETTVAIEFAASFSPLRKSNSSAVAIRPISSGAASVALMLGDAHRCSMTMALT